MRLAFPRHLSRLSSLLMDTKRPRQARTSHWLRRPISGIHLPWNSVSRTITAHHPTVMGSWTTQYWLRAQKNLINSENISQSRHPYPRICPVLASLWSRDWTQRLNNIENYLLVVCISSKKTSVLITNRHTTSHVEDMATSPNGVTLKSELKL